MAAGDGPLLPAMPTSVIPREPCPRRQGNSATRCSEYAHRSDRHPVRQPWVLRGPAASLTHARDCSDGGPCKPAQQGGTGVSCRPQDRSGSRRLCVQPPTVEWPALMRRAAVGEYLMEAAPCMPVRRSAPCADQPTWSPRTEQPIQPCRALCRGQPGRRIFASAGRWPSSRVTSRTCANPGSTAGAFPRQAGRSGLVAALGRVPGPAAPQQ